MVIAKVYCVTQLCRVANSQKLEECRLSSLSRRCILRWWRTCHFGTWKSMTIMMTKLFPRDEKLCALLFYFWDPNQTPSVGPSSKIRKEVNTVFASELLGGFKWCYENPSSEPSLGPSVDMRNKPATVSAVELFSLEWITGFNQTGMHLSSSIESPNHCHLCGLQVPSTPFDNGEVRLKILRSKVLFE